MSNSNHYDLAIEAYWKGRYEEAITICGQLREQLTQKLSSTPPQQWLLYQRLFKNLRDVVRLAAGCFRLMGRHDEAIFFTRQLLQTDPNNPGLHVNLAISLLSTGQFAEGWEEFEWRYKNPKYGLPVLSSPRWQGEDLSGKTILILCEQGYGDCIQFARYLPLVRERADKLILFCSRPLEPLFRDETYIDQLVVAEERVSRELDKIGPDIKFDVQNNIFSLGKIFSANPTNIPKPNIFRVRSEKLNRTWKARLSDSGFNIGIAWSGSAIGDDEIFHRSNRNIQFEEFLRLLEVSSVHLYTLQPHQEIEEAPERFHQLGTEIRDFGDTAAIISQLDLVISVDTALAHLALTLGRNTWVVLQEVPDWRWESFSADGIDGRGDDSSACIWYPEARLFREAVRGDKKDAMNQVVAALNEDLAGKS